MNGAALSITVILCSLWAATWSQTLPGMPTTQAPAISSPYDLIRLFQGLAFPFGGGAVPSIPPVGNLPPAVEAALQVPRNGAYSYFSAQQGALTNGVIRALMNVDSYRDLYALGQVCHDRLNRDMFFYAMSEVMLHRNDTRGVPVPGIYMVFPDKFFSSDILAQIYGQDAPRLQKRSTTCSVTIPLDHRDDDSVVERRLKYFREDIALNAHHWHWHLAYPFSGDRSMVDRNRRGELFYYQHQQIMARYNFERFSCFLARTAPITTMRTPLEEGYNPNLNSTVTGRQWPPRADNTLLRDVNRPRDQLQANIALMEQWVATIQADITSGSALNSQSQRVQLSDPTGIDLLGNIVEASILTINRQRYGDYHNSGHIVIGYVHDPNGTRGMDAGVMADPATAMRDIAFYRWHEAIDRIFQEHKRRLPSYSANQLGFNGVYITGMSVITITGYQNTFFTHFQRSEIDLSFGVDFNTTGPRTACITHLQHVPFSYRFQVNNDGPARTGTVRIFMAPKYDEYGRQLTLTQQRLLYIELDKFQAPLRYGLNVVERFSSQSSVTIPFEQSFRRLRQRELTGAALDQFNYCGCGWPQHMLIPKGRANGLPVQLFVMVSDFAQDGVNQPPNSGCSKSHSYCGLRDQLYPDRRSMGYPFDRPPVAGIDIIRDWVTPNMGVQDMTIYFRNKVLAAGVYD